MISMCICISEHTVRTIVQFVTHRLVNGGGGQSGGWISLCVETENISSKQTRSDMSHSKIYILLTQIYYNER